MQLLLGGVIQLRWQHPGSPAVGQKSFITHVCLLFHHIWKICLYHLALPDSENITIQERASHKEVCLVYAALVLPKKGTYRVHRALMIDS